MSTRQKKWVYICVISLVLLSLCCLVDYLDIFNKSPEEQFIIDFDIKVNSLINEMRNARGTWKQKASIFGSGKAGYTELETPRMMRVTKAAKELSDHFKMVPLSVLLALENIDYQEWGVRVQNKYLLQQERFEKEVQKLEQDIRDNPSLYPKSQIAELAILGNELAVYGWTKDDQLYLVSGNQGIILGRLLDFDIEKRLKSIQSKLKKQGPIYYSKGAIDYSTNRGDPIPLKVTVDGYLDATSGNVKKSFRIKREYIEIERFEYKTGGKLTILGRMRWIDNDIPMPPGVEYFEKRLDETEPNDIVNVIVE